MNRLRLPLFAAILMQLLCGGPGFAQELIVECGKLSNHYGPYDYSNPDHRARYLPIVETAHFTTNVETLTRGQSSDNIPGDIDYTLRAFPNHPRALDAMARWQLANGRPPTARHYSADCYFVRAMTFKPDDGMVRMIYGIYLHKKGDYEGALLRYQEALELMPDSAEAHYNLGLLYTDLKRYREALDSARRAYALGYPLPGLQVRLRRAGVWSDQPEETSSARVPARETEVNATGQPTAVPDPQ